MTRNYYELLGVGATAEPEEIKRAFRREIARYHPDKVQHLGHEFQEIASVRAAALTEAYRVLMDDQARRRYDDGDGKGTRATAAAPPRPAAADAPTAPHVPSHRPADPADGAEEKPDSRIQQTRETTSTFVKKASLGMLREAVSLAAAGVMELPAPGFDAAYVVKGKHRLFSGKEPVVRLLARFVPHVTPASVAEVWPLAAAAATKDQIACVLLLGVGLAPSKELSTAVAEQRRKTRSAGPVIVPVDVRDWDALLPPEIPASARAILQQLKDGKR